MCIKEPCVRKFEGLERSKRLGIFANYIAACRNTSQETQLLENENVNNMKTERFENVSM